MPVTRILASSTLLFEAFSVFFGGLVAMQLSSLSTGTALILFTTLAVLCLVAAGLLRSRYGYWLGSVLQVAVVASGFWTHAMFVVGGAFALLWIAAIVLGGRAEREGAARQAAMDAAEAAAEAGEAGAGPDADAKGPAA